MLADEFGREVSGVRVSLTDRCNFDCVYCHNEGLGDTRGPMDPQDDEMSTDDVVRFLEVAAEFGVDAVKFTGGEPMLRQDLEEIVARTPDSMEVSLTTNGTFLPGRAEGLVEAGLERVNVSQDAMDREAFAAVTLLGRRAFDLPLEKVNPLGGAVSIGHPIGASGARILTTLLNVLDINEAKYGLATLCLGGGEGNALIVERV